MCTEVAKHWQTLFLPSEQIILGGKCLIKFFERVEALSISNDTRHKSAQFPNDIFGLRSLMYPNTKKYLKDWMVFL